MELYENEGQYYLAFSYFHKIGPARILRLATYFPDMGAAFRASAYYLEQAGLESRLASEFVNWRKSFNFSGALADLRKNDLKYITWSDSLYPERLRQIPSPPPVLFYWGNWLPKREKNPLRLAVVGAREPTAYAFKAITTILEPLIGAGLEIISGLAKGVDALAHQAALTSGGRTIAVLGSGLNDDYIYPRENRPLLKNILARGGLVISEFPPTMPALKTNFPRRNRIIAGLAQATLVVEAKAKSGALITADFALEQNRDVLAIPGNIFSPLSAGTNNLIKAGAKAITSADDIAEVFGLELTTAASTKFSKDLKPVLSDHEHIIYNIIKQAADRSEKISADEIMAQASNQESKALQLDTPTTNSILSILEIKGMITAESGFYELKN